MFQPNMFEPHHHMFDLPIHKINNDSDFSKLIMDDEFETKPGFDHIMDISSGDDLDPTQRPRKKRFRRHTQRQIQEMEAFFKECPYPDDKQRKELSRELGLELLQVKFWFQNKRTQIKAQHERHENSMLKAENEKLRAEVARNAEALSITPCPKCGGPAGPGEMSFDEQQLRIEIAGLKEEVDRLSGIAAKYVGKSLLSNTNNISPYNNNVPKPHASRFGTKQSMVGVGVGVGVGEMYGACHEVLRSDKPMIVELALSAMEELLMVAQASSPLWVPGENSGETLNEEEYLRTFSRGIGLKPLGFKTEASRESIVVVADHMNLVEYLMDVDKWSNVFCGIVSKAATIEVLSSGVGGNFNGAIQVMKAEFQVPSPLVPVRENYMVRYSKQHGEGVWAVVDVSLDSSRPSLATRGRRRPSGCLIQELANGYSKVTWVEHVEVGDKAVNPIYRPLVSSGLAFGAKRWVSTLERQCERLASLMATHISAGGPFVITSAEGRKSMMRLAERMVLSFCGGVGASTTHAWTTLSTTGFDNVRIMTRKSMDEPGGPLGIVLSATTSLWLPVPPKQVFDFLRNEKSRSEWDILSNGGIVQEMAHIANGRVPGNSVSLLRVNSANSSQSNMLILQESCSDSTGSYVIYAPVDNGAMNLVLTGGDPDHVALLPSGFAILPDGPGSGATAGGGGAGILEVGSGGSLLTVSFQILVDSVPTAKLSLGSVATVNSLIKCTIKRIKAAVLRGGAASKNKKMRHNM